MRPGRRRVRESRRAGHKKRGEIVTISSRLYVRTPSATAAEILLRSTSAGSENDH